MLQKEVRMNIFKKKTLTNTKENDFDVVVTFGGAIKGWDFKVKGKLIYDQIDIN